MYAVVGCGECQALWIVEGRPERSQCPRCGKTRKYEKRREFVTTDDEDHAREVRSSMLATRQDQDEAFAELDSFAELDAQVEDAGIDDETYLEASGIDAEAVAEAGESDRQRSQSREDIVREAVRELDEPGEDNVVAYASERGVPDSFTRRALTKLVRAGECSEDQGTYRLLSATNG
jgi:adenine-specific DNA methylase